MHVYMSVCIGRERADRGPLGNKNVHHYFAPVARRLAKQRACLHACVRANKHVRVRVRVCWRARTHLPKHRAAVCVLAVYVDCFEEDRQHLDRPV